MSKEIERLLPEKRYPIALSEMLKEQHIYVLEEKENAFAVSEFEGNTLLAIWSNESFAANNVSHSWSEFRPKRIPMSELEVILEFAEDNNWLLDVFPIGGKTGEVVTVEEFITDLNTIAERENNK